MRQPQTIPPKPLEYRDGPSPRFVGALGIILVAVLVAAVAWLPSTQARAQDAAYDGLRFDSSPTPPPGGDSDADSDSGSPEPGGDSPGDPPDDEGGSPETPSTGLLETLQADVVGLKQEQAALKTYADGAWAEVVALKAETAALQTEVDVLKALNRRLDAKSLALDALLDQLAGVYGR